MPPAPPCRGYPIGDGNLVNAHDDSGEIAPGEPPHRQLAALFRILDAVAWLCMLVAGIALVIVILTFGWLVYGRYVLNSTPTWVEQLSLLLISYITFLGAAVGIYRNSHLSIDFIRESLPGLPRIIMRYLSNLLVLAFGVGMAWQGWVLVSTNLKRFIPMLGVAESWRALPILICGVLIVIFTSAEIANRIVSRGDHGE